MKKWHPLAWLRLQSAKIWRALKHDIKLLTPLRIAEGVLVAVVMVQCIVLTINALATKTPALGLRLEGHVIGRLHTDFKQQVNAIIRDYENKSITVKVADTTSSITLRQLGVDIDEEKIYAELLAVGRTGDGLARFIDQNRTFFGGHDVSLEKHAFNNDLASAYITTLDQKIGTLPTNAYFAYENQKVVLHPDTQGKAIDTNAAIAALRGTNPLRGSEVVLPIKSTSAVATAALLIPLLPQVEAIAKKSLTIAAGSSQAILTPEQLVALIVPKIAPDPQDPQKTVAQISFDEAKLNAAVDEVVKKAVVAPQPRIMNGNQVVQQGKDGVRIEDSHAAARVLSALMQRQTGAASPDIADIPLATVSPPVVQQAVNNPRTRTGTGLVRLTFDDGPGAYTEQVLNILKRYNVHGTFYVIGRNVQRYPGTMQRIKNEGHTIGNHSFTHANLSHLSRSGVQQELANTQEAIRAACGVTPTAFRPPYGAQNQTVREVAASMGMSVDLWSVDTRDWAQPGSSVITQRVLAGTGPGAVVLLHVLNQQTVNALPSIIEGVRAQGYTLE